MSRANREEIDRYYQQFFPREEACALWAREWTGSSQLCRRELAFETHDDVYIRWLSAASSSDLLKMFKSMRPCKLHSGAVYSQQPSFKKKGIAVTAEAREFVVDIDVNDYTSLGVDSDDVEACDAAWPIVAFGMKVITYILKHHFGFHNVLTVYSGRRGAHTTVYDKRACMLRDEARSAMDSFMQPSDKHTQGGRTVYGNMMSYAFFGDLYDSHIEPFWTGFCILPRGEGGLGVLDTPRDKALALSGTPTRRRSSFFRA